MKVQSCARCDNCRWVCENHTDRPWLGARACGCGGAGAPCPICNAGRRLPPCRRCQRASKPDAVNKGFGGGSMTEARRQCRTM